MLYYYKREVAAGSDEKPQGEINTTKDCVGILTSKQVATNGLIKWPEDAGPNTGRYMLCSNLETAIATLTSVSCRVCARNQRWPYIFLAL
jgi:hypothetical protein